MSTDLRITSEQYDLMVRSGAFDGEHRQRVELIRGEILPMSPIGALHEVLVDRLAEWSFLQTPRDKVWVRVQNSIGLAELESVPEPDIAWVARKDYSARRPQGEDVFLVVEAADTSLRYDLGAKAGLYAEAGVADYWVVDANDRRLTVFRSPEPGGYRNQEAFSPGALVHPLAFTQITLEISRLFEGLHEAEA
jgi:Uma2 family endonuclease